VRQHDLVTYRRSKDDPHKARMWHDFTLSQRELFDKAGLPGLLSEDQDAFEDFLMEGFLPMPGGLADGTRFSADELGATQRDSLDELATCYVEQFGDPGVSLGPRRDET
jgi:hypothetical protein